MNEKHRMILEELKSKSIISVGGTEAVSVAYSVAYARQRAGGRLKRYRLPWTPAFLKTGSTSAFPAVRSGGWILQLPLAMCAAIWIGN